MPGQGQACAAGNRTYGRSHGKSFGELLKELGSGLVSSRMREGNASSLFVVWQPENFLLLSLETRGLFYIYVIPGMFLLRVPVPQPGTVSAPEHLAPGKRSRRAGGEGCCRHRKHLQIITQRAECSTGANCASLPMLPFAKSPLRSCRFYSVPQIYFGWKATCFQ